jgi:hypothetical protein
MSIRGEYSVLKRNDAGNGSIIHSAAGVNVGNKQLSCSEPVWPSTCRLDPFIMQRTKPRAEGGTWART